MSGGSVYAQKGSPTGSVYAQKGASSGSVYANHGAAAAPPKKHGHGGLLGAAEHAAHWTAEKAGLAAHDVKTIPGGTVQLARDEYGALKQSVKHPWVSGPNDPNYVDNTPAGRKLNADIKGMAHATVTSVRHPLRDPFQTGLTALAALGVTGGTLGRAAEVGKAGSLGDAAKAAIRTPPVRPRLLTVGDTQVSLHPSANPTVRAGQGLYDRVLQRGLDKNPEGRVAAHAASRIGGSLRETGRYQERMRAVPADLLEQAAKRLAPTRGHVPFTGSKRLQRVEQAAMELTSVNTSPEAAAAYHLAQAEKGVNPGLNRAVAKLYDTVRKRGMLTQNEHGDVIVNAAKHPKLAETDVRLANVQGKGDEILARYDVRTREALRAAVDAPGKYRAGATYEKPTAAKEGVPSQSLLKARGRVARLEALHERAIARASEKAVPYPNVHTRTGLVKQDLKTAPESALKRQHVEVPPGPRTPGAPSALPAKGLTTPTVTRLGGALSVARDDLARMEQQAASRVKPTGIVEGPIVYHGTGDLGAKLSVGSPEWDNNFFVSNDRKVAEHYAARHINSRVDTYRLDPRAKVLTPNIKPIDYTPERLSAIVKKARSQGYDAVHFGGGKETVILNRDKLLPGVEARPGRGHVSYAGSEPKAPRSAVASSAGPIVGEAKAPVTSHANQGINIGLGKVPKDVTGQAARHYRQIVRFVNTTEHRNAALRTGSPARRSSRDVLVSIPGEAHAKIPAAVNEILGKTKLTHDDIQGVHAALEAYKQDMVSGLRDRFTADRNTPIGTTAEDAAAAQHLAPGGRMWVDQNVLGDLAKPGAGPRGKIARSVDNVNSAVTAATVYFKIGHVGTRALTNAATNIIQGSAHPLEVAKSFRLWDKLSDGDRLRALAAAGQHGFQAMPHEGQSVVSRIAGSGANFWARRFDSPFRFNQIAYEARRAGFDTPAKFRQMLDRMENPEGLNAAQQAKVDYVAKRANREGIAYDRLSEFERRYLTRALWFYPWLKGTVGFAANTAMEHPYKATTLGKLGEQGRQQQAQQLGDLPSYEHGLYQLAGPDASGKPLVADFSTFSPYATPADIGEAVTHPAELSGFLNPVGTAGTNLMFGLNQFGSKSQSPLEDAAASLASPTPEAQILSAFLQRHKDQSKRMFPKSSAWYGTHDPVIRALLGPGTPRRLNPAAAHSTAARERTGR